LTLTDLHSYALTFRQLSQPASLERCGMDENILPIAILPYEAKPLVAIVHFHPADAFRGGPGTRLLLRMGSRDRAPRLCAHHLTCIDLNYFGDLWALLPLTDSDLDPGALGHAAVPCGLQLTDVQECLGPTDDGDESKAFLCIEPFDDCCDRL